MVENTCRICQETDNKNFVAPCDCSGSMKHVHVSCLKKWIIASKNITKCPTCKSNYRDVFTNLILHESFADFELLNDSVEKVLIKMTLLVTMIGLIILILMMKLIQHPT